MARTVLQDVTQPCVCSQLCPPQQRVRPQIFPYVNSQPACFQTKHSLLRSKTSVCYAGAVQSQSTLPQLDQEFQAWWQSADVKADALVPAEFAGRFRSADRQAPALVLKHSHSAVLKILEAWQQQHQSTLVTALSLCPEQQPCL